MRDYSNFSNNMMRRGWWIIAIMVVIAIIAMFSGGGDKGGEVIIPPDGVFGEGEFRGINLEPKTGFINGQNFVGQRVQYLEIDGEAVFEGDILLYFENGDPMAAGLGVVGRNTINLRWPDGLVPYEINPNLTDQVRVLDAIEHWEANTQIRFVERTPETAAQYPNYIQFRTGGGCSSYVGMIGGMQPIYLAPACTTGSTIHEIGHAVGLWHEQSRADRDEYVTIHYENIIVPMIFNFDQHINDGEDIGEYDFVSIMHYPRWAFSRNGKDTIVPKNNEDIGQRDRLSEGDLAAVEAMYAGVIAGR